MPIDWQNLLVLAIVGVAVGYLARKSWLAMRGKSKKGCGSCGSCPANKTADAGKPLVEIKELLAPKR